ncbi:hypothetical protein ACFQS1_35105 [Paractinoplanes rhizophilus]|uniref:Uncharacterized protein n=1 Tax=Paractinoplanes rhizophilus TaxID=1416877 RepID=A0ABW2I317_9ACTN
MLVTVPDPGLSQVLESDGMILDRWRDAANDVMVLLQLLLHTAARTLAEVLALGLIVLAASPAARSALILQYRRVSLVVLGRRADGSEVTAAQDHPEEVTHLEVHGVRVAALAQARP